MEVLPDISDLIPNGVMDPAVSDPIVTTIGRRGMHANVSTVPIRRNALFLCAAVALIILVLYNVVIRRVARSSKRQQFLATLAVLPKDTDLLFLGNSLVEAGCDVQAFQRSWTTGAKVRAENIALGATYPTEHCLILRRAFQSGVRPSYVIYGFFDDQLNATPTGNFSDLVRNRALAYYFPDEAAEMYAPGSAFKKWEMRLCGWLPMISERSSLWNMVDYGRERLEELGMPRQERTHYGLVKNFSALEADDVKDFENRCFSAVQKGQFSIPVQKIIQMTREHGAKLVLVEMPMPSRHRRLFYSTQAWSVLRDQLQQSAMQNDTMYISAADWVTNDNEFEDVIHLNETGAKDFSAKLAQALQRLPQVPKNIAATTLNTEN